MHCELSATIPAVGDTSRTFVVERRGLRTQQTTA
jgi:hypothetical protein